MVAYLGGGRVEVGSGRPRGRITPARFHHGLSDTVHGLVLTLGRAGASAPQAQIVRELVYVLIWDFTLMRSLVVDKSQACP